MKKPNSNSAENKYGKIRSTTVIAVRRDGKVAMAGDGQVTMGETVM
jgi:ATP-dependent HslUV protease subunit HslV